MSDPSANNPPAAPWHEVALQSDRATLEIGVFCLKALIAANAGALIALLGLYPPMDKAPSIRAAIPGASLGFAGGLVLALFSAGCAYFFQSRHTTLAFALAIGERRKNRWVLHLMCGTVGLAILSLVTFLVGLGTMVWAFQSSLP